MEVQDAGQAEQFVKDQLLVNESSGSRDRQFWAIQMDYERGRQWARTGHGPHGNLTTVKLSPVLDPSRPDIRVTMNIISENTRKVDSKITPNEIPFSVDPQEDSDPEDHVLAAVGGNYLQQIVEDKGLLPIYQYASCRRCVLGSNLIKMVFAGQTADASGYAKRDFRFAQVDPWQITHDRYNQNPDFNCHTWLIHSYANPVDDINQRFGTAIEPLAEMGKLVVDEANYFANPGSDKGGADQSKTPGCIVHELYIGQEPGEFSRLYMFAKGKDPDFVQLWPSHGQDEAPSPFPGLPFLKLDLWPRTGSVWGCGVPGANINAQDIHNLAWTNILRYLVQLSWVKWMAAAESLTPDTRKKLLNNQMAALIEYRRSPTGDYDPPQPVKPPELPSTAADLIQTIPGTARRQAGLEDISFGQVSKRGVPSGTAKLQIEQADTLIAKVAATDVQRLKKFLQVIAGFPVVNRDYFGLAERVGGRFSSEALMAYMGMDPRRPALKFYLNPGALLPKTPSDVVREQLMYLESGMVSPQEVRHMIWRKTGVALSSMDEPTFRLVEEENRRMLQGQAVPVEPVDVHEIHIAGHTLLANSPRRFDYGPQVMDVLYEHIREHEQAHLAKTIERTAPDLAGQPSRTQDGSAAQIANGMAGRQLGGRSPNLRNVARANAASPEQLVA